MPGRGGAHGKLWGWRWADTADRQTDFATVWGLGLLLGKAHKKQVKQPGTYISQHMSRALNI